MILPPNESLKTTIVLISALRFKLGYILYVVLNLILVDKAEQLADVWLESLAKGCMHQYIEQILKIPALTQHANKQLCMDIGQSTSAIAGLMLGQRRRRWPNNKPALGPEPYIYGFYQVSK